MANNNDEWDSWEENEAVRLKRTIALAGKDPKPGATFALTILTILNLLNYATRYVPSTTKENVKKEFDLSDEETSYPVFVFLFVYMLASPLFATLSDKGFSRKLMLLFGGVMWAIAAVAPFFFYSWYSFLVSRALLGIGEATFSTIAPALLCDYYPPERRNVVMMVFYLSMPIGGAMGFASGAIFSKITGWRSAYLFTGAPGFFVSLLVLFFIEPGLGSFEVEVVKESWVNTVKIFWAKKMYLVILFGSVIVTFGTGAMADWLPTYFERQNPYLTDFDAGIMVGSVTVAGGVFGTVLGAFFAEHIAGKIRNHRMFVCWVAILGSSIFQVVALYIENVYSTLVSLLIAQAAIFMATAPLMAEVANLMPGPVRARAYAIQTLLMHALGDSVSPLVIGYLSDIKSIGLKASFAIVPLLCTVGGISYLLGWWLVTPQVSDIRELRSDEIEELLNPITQNNTEQPARVTIDGSSFSDFEKGSWK